MHGTAVEPGKPFTARLRDFGKTTASYHAAMRRVRLPPPVTFDRLRLTWRDFLLRGAQAAAADFKESIVQVTAGSFQDDEAYVLVPFPRPLVAVPLAGRALGCPRPLMAAPSNGRALGCPCPRLPVPSHGRAL